VIALPFPPRLTPPSSAVRTAYLVGEQADMVHRGADTSWLARASADFDAFVAERVGVRERWGVPSEILWFTSSDYYIGTLVIRHQLTGDEGGGHIGYHVVYPWQRQGHATSMLREGLVRARELGIERVLLTVAPDNEASRKAIERNAGIADGMNHESELRFWIETRTTGEQAPLPKGSAALP
jgi:predicted acetyltransferase